jgi:hypothetical protein
VSQPVPPPAHPEPAQDGAALPYSPAGQPFDGDSRPTSKLKKVAGIAIPVAGALVAGASWLGIGGPADPEVGDCVKTAGSSDYDVVDCGGDDAEYKVVGVEAEKYSEEEFNSDQTLCAGFATTEMVLWSGDMGSDGTVLCAEPA